MHSILATGSKEIQPGARNRNSELRTRNNDQVLAVTNRYWKHRGSARNDEQRLAKGSKTCNDEQGFVTVRKNLQQRA